MAHIYNPTEHSDRLATIAAAKTAVARLNDIIANVDTATTGQLKAALKDVATYEKHLIKLVAGSL